MSKQSNVVERYVEAERLDHRTWKRALGDGVLLGQECRECEQRTAVPKAVCSRCGASDLAPVELPTSGEVITETTIEVPPEEFEGPHQVAIIDLGRCRVMAGIDGAVEIGDDVELVGTLERDDEPGLLFGEVPAIP